MTDDRLDGSIGEAWSGEVPNGSHLNVVLGRRGSPTAAAIAGVLGEPAPRARAVPGLPLPGHGRAAHDGRGQQVTIPARALGRITWGAAQLGIAQGVLDAVADGLLDAGEAADVVMLAALWVDPERG